MERAFMSENRYVGKFYVASVIFFFVGSLQGGLQYLYLEQLEALPEAIHGLIVGLHTHLNLLGWVSTAMMGTIYVLLPMVTGKPIRSIKLADVGFWFFAAGAALFYVVGIALTLGGLFQLGPLILVSLILLAIGIWIFIANVILSATRK